ncbi:MAG TPA: hypothetical protein VFK43_07010, partial [Acidimicrobiales bacterium]|nr:hypothetical protein [Acidimicrobiales bacterium]
MSTSTRLAGFGVALIAVLGIGAGVGATIGPDASTGPDDDVEAPAPEGGGVVAAAEGYRIVPESPTLAAEGGPFSFTIVDVSGDPVTRFTEVHDRPLHLIVVSRELMSFEHVHPSLEGATWTVDLPALAAGSYRAVADF